MLLVLPVAPCMGLSDFELQEGQLFCASFVFWTIKSRKPKAKSAGRVPPDAILLSGNKSMQKCLLLAEGISSAGFLWSQQTTELKKPARYRGAFRSV